jgi:hypothetical protein
MKDRSLSFLAVALLIEAAAGFTPWIAAAAPTGSRPYPSPPWDYRSSAALAGLLGTVCLLEFQRKRPRLLFGAAFLGMATTGVIHSLGWIVGQNFASPALWYLISIPSTILMTAGGTLFWGAAVVRRDFPEHPGLTGIGRLGAKLGITGLVLSVLQQIPGIIFTMQRVQQMNVGLYPLLSVFQVAWRVLFLWCAVDMLRRLPDPAVCRLRMRRVDRMLWASVGVAAGSTLLRLFLNFKMAQQPLPNLWHNILYLLMFIACAFATARWARWRFEGSAA